MSRVQCLMHSSSVKRATDPISPAGVPNSYRPSIKRPTGCSLSERFLDLAEGDSRANHKNGFVHFGRIELVLLEVNFGNFLQDFAVGDLPCDSFQHDGFVRSARAKDAIRIVVEIARLHRVLSGAEIKMAAHPHAP